jgi:hypothetical protein
MMHLLPFFRWFSHVTTCNARGAIRRAADNIPSSLDEIIPAPPILAMPLCPDAFE